MPEIGTSLREARMRQRIDISEVEAETKIRAKYLRALENEEWNLLPGPTYVKSFLRTYADALGLDGRLLVEEYKLRHERLSDIELQPITPPRVRDRRRRAGGGVPRGWVVAIVLVALVAALYALSRIGANNAPDNTSSGPAATTPTGKQSRSERRRRRSSSQANRGATPARPRIVRLQIVPTGPVYVCLVDAAGRRLVNGAVLQPGAAQPTYRSRRFLLTLGNANALLKINGRSRTVPPVTSGIGYEITRKNGRRTLSAATRPTCAG